MNLKPKFHANTVQISIAENLGRQARDVTLQAGAVTLNNRWSTRENEANYPATNWLQSEFENALLKDNPTQAKLVTVTPSTGGYDVRLNGTDVDAKISHSEIAADDFHVGKVLDEINSISLQQLTTRGSRILGAIRRGIPAQVSAGAAALRKAMRPKEKSQTAGTTDKIKNLERTSMKPKDFNRKVPKPIILNILINGMPVQALLDTGCMADFMSTTVADQLKVKMYILAKPITVQMAVHGSRSKINCSTTVRLQYQKIDCQRRFDIVNLDNYDVILGTPFIFQHKVIIGMNPTHVAVGSDAPLPLEGTEVTTIVSAAADLYQTELDKFRNMLKDEGQDLCPDTANTSLPPLRTINHQIPIMDKSKIYPWRPAKCPEAMGKLGRDKRDAYVKTGRWRTATGVNAIPILLIPKVAKADGVLRLRTVFDKRERNKNTHKMTAPLPGIE